jgi:ATP-dependent Clp protease, protease subunit
MKPAKWNINAELSEAEVMLYGDIGEDWFGEGISAKAFIEELNGIGPGIINTLRVRINSPGGDVFEGFAIYQALLRHKSYVVVEIDALAASAASVIAMAGDEIRMADTSLMMVHDPWSFAVGNAAEFRETADLLDIVAGNIITAYARRPGVDRGAIKDAMSAETWYTASEALNAGLVDSVVESAMAVAAKVPPGRYRNTPDRLVGGEADKPDGRCARRRLESAKRALLLAENA